MSDHAFLRVVRADDEPLRPVPAPDDLAPDSTTLVEFFWRYAWPDVLAAKGDKAATRKDYVKSLEYWSVAVGSPPLAKITKRTCSQFLGKLRLLRYGKRRRLLSPASIHKHWVNIERLLRMAGPAERHNPAGADVLERPPWLQGPKREHLAPLPPFTLDELWRWLEVLPREARPMPKIAGYDPPQWWRAVILVGYNSSMRSGTLFRIRWEMIKGHLLPLPPGIVKSKRGHLIWLNQAALRALEPLRRPGKAEGLVFGWPGWPAGESTLRKHRLRLQKIAGVPTFGLKGLRRAFSTECGKINPLAMQLQMGHVGLGMRMAAEHYVSAERVLEEALEKLPQPGRAIQARLF